MKEEDIEKKDMKKVNQVDTSEEDYCSIFVDRDLKKKSNEKLYGKDKLVELEFQRRETNKKLMDSGVKSWEIADDSVVKNLPFMEVDSYFGEFELFDDSPRKWTVVAKKKCVVYSIPKYAFLEIFRPSKRRDMFLIAMMKRLIKFEKSEKETKRSVKRFDQVKKRISVGNKLKNMLNKIKPKWNKKVHPKQQ